MIRAIRARGDARARVPIVALTAYAMREHRERIAAAGANGVISKPITSVEALGRGLAAHVTRVPAALPGGAAPAADAGGPVIDQAIYAALEAAIGPETMAELLDKVVADLLARAAATSSGRSTSSTAPACARPRTSSSRSPAPSARCGCRAAPARSTPSPRPVPPSASSPPRRRCIGEIDAAVAAVRDRRAAG